MNARRSLSRNRAGFTLIEMLVVVIIILLLSMILLRTAAFFGDQAKRKECVHDLEQLQNALNEYYVEYGKYPPVDFLTYEYECSASNYQTKAFKDWLAMHNDPEKDIGEFFPDTKEHEVWPKNTIHPDWSLGYKYGLVAYLWHRDMGTQTHWYDKDSDNDAAAKNKWVGPFLSEVGLSGGNVSYTSSPSMGINTIWTNCTQTISDPWGNEYRYVSRPPYVRYRLWSVGPDGSSGTKDDVTYQSWNE